MGTDKCDKLSEDQGQILVGLARRTIMHRLGISMSEAENDTIEKGLSDERLHDSQGVFVTLSKGGNLRGCIGSLTGVESIKEGVRRNALNAAFSDYRFSPLTDEELGEIDIEVSVLSDPEPLLYEDSEDLLRKLKPGIDGVILKKGSRSATFLPQVWKQLPDVDAFLSHLALKAGLTADAWKKGDTEIQVYQVQYFHEEK